jgi:hypothetical protein
MSSENDLTPQQIEDALKVVEAYDETLPWYGHWGGITAIRGALESNDPERLYSAYVAAIDYPAFAEHDPGRNPDLVLKLAEAGLTLEEVNEAGLIIAKQVITQLVKLGDVGQAKIAALNSAYPDYRNPSALSTSLVDAKTRAEQARLAAQQEGLPYPVVGK